MQNPLSQWTQLCIHVGQQFTKNITQPKVALLKKKKKNLFPVSLPDPFEAFIIFSIRHEIRRIDLHKRDYSLLVPGLRNTIALDFHFNRSLLYWTDVVEDKIYRGRLSESGGMNTHEYTHHMYTNIYYI